jgi:hypothetical protein
VGTDFAGEAHPLPRSHARAYIPGRTGNPGDGGETEPFQSRHQGGGFGAGERALPPDLGLERVRIDVGLAGQGGEIEKRGILPESLRRMERPIPCFCRFNADLAGSHSNSTCHEWP